MTRPALPLVFHFCTLRATSLKSGRVEPFCPTSRSWKSEEPGLEVWHSTRTPLSAYSRNGSRESFPRYGLTVTASNPQKLEDGLSVRLSRRTDVASLGVADDGDVIRFYVLQGALKGLQAIGIAQGFVEGDMFGL